MNADKKGDLSLPHLPSSAAESSAFSAPPRQNQQCVRLLSMKLKVNGDDRELTDGITVRELVQQFKLVPEKVAIELNRRLIRAEKYDQPLEEGDEVEIVTFVGGG
jgi:sulfur carrier protein